MAYGRFGGAPKFWHHGVDGWLSLEDGRQSSPVVRRQEINGGGGCLGDLEERDGGSGCQKFPRLEA